MEVNKTPSFIRDFLPKITKRIIVISLLIQLLVSGIFLLVILVTSSLTLDSLEIWIITGLIFITGLASNIIIFTLTNLPTKSLLSAIIHIAGEPTSTPPPNPNDKIHVKSGLGLALQTIYELSVNSAKSVQTTGPITPTSKEPEKTTDPIRSALDATPCGFVVLNHDRKITYYNKMAPIKIDKDNQASLMLLFNGTDSLDNWLKECELNSVHSEHVWTRISDKLPDEEGRRFFDVIASYDKGAVHEVVLTLVDRTAAYSVGEQDLDFIAFAAHELRGPITVIRGYLDVLEDELAGVLQEDQHELFRRLTVSANRLAGYINNILNTSRYDRRHLKVNLAEDKVTDIYDTIQDDMQLRAKSQNRVLSVNFPVDLPTIAADRTSIGEVIVNLIDNAIKYSNEGGAINVTANARGDYVEIHVQDFGIGMPGNVVSNLFQKFYRSHRSRETVAGTGIGLYISKAIVESHGGTISVTSEEGKGSTFTVSLPIYATVADKLSKGENSNEGLIEHGSGWIKNHSMYRG